METCDGLSVETPYGPSRCILMQGTSCTVANTTPAPIIVSTSAPTSGNPTPAPIFTSPILTPTVGSPTPAPTMNCKDNEIFDEKKGKCKKKKKKKSKGSRRLDESRKLIA